MNLIFFNKKECKHEQISPYIDSGYCPDCGEYVFCNWYMLRCTCCNIKREGMIKNNIIFPKNKFCTNCGGNEFYLVKIKKISFIDLKYAILKKETKKDIIKSNLSVYWLDEKIEELKVIKNISY
ncbi:MAG: hypothetical protein MRZ90_07965 [Candidatus Gastranaerophilales bacterium]|nr:hypothetical protein [Candidatus Gastranaerophilales bacterium]